MTLSVVVSNVLFNDARVDASKRMQCGTIDASISSSTIGKAIQMLVKNSDSRPILSLEEVYNSSERPFMVRPNREHVVCTLGKGQKVIVQKDFMPEPFLGDTIEQTTEDYIKAGLCDAAKLASLETVCRCICDVTFSGIQLSPIKVGHIDALQFCYNSISLTVKSDIVLLGIGITTGCPNYG